MLNIEEAIKIINESLPESKIQAWVTYNDLYLFQVFSNRPFEEELDPFFSVNKKTGEFRDFSVLTDGNITEIAKLFKNATRLKST